MKALFRLFVLILLSPGALAQSFSLSQLPESGQLLGRHIRVALAPADSLSPEAALKFVDEQGMVPEVGSPGMGFQKNTDAWITAVVHNDLPNHFSGILGFRIADPDLVKFYRLEKGEPVYVAASGDWQPFNLREYKYLEPVVPVSIVAGQTDTLLIRVFRVNSSLQLPLELWSSEQFRIYLSNKRFWHGSLLGSLLVYVCFSLVLTWFMRQWLFGLHSLYALSTFLYVFIHFGYAFQYLYPDVPLLNDYMRVYSAIITTLFFALFSVKLLRLKSERPLSYRVVQGCLLIITAVLVVSAIFPEYCFEHFNYIFVGLYLMFIVLHSTLLLSAALMALRGSRMAKIYTLAFAFLIIGIVLMIGREMNFWPDTPWVSGLVWVALILELLSLILVLGLYIRDTLTRYRHLSVMALFRGEEAERERVGTALHDGIANNLLAARYALSPEGQATAYQIVDQTFNEVRSLAHEMYPPVLRERGLTAELNEWPVRYAHALKVIIDTNGDEQHISLQEQLLLYRVAQELLSNALKYASATEVRISLAFSPGETRLTVRDNGMGFDPAKTKPGQGLRSIRDRINALGDASFKIKSVPGKGAEFVVRIVHLDGV